MSPRRSTSTSTDIIDCHTVSPPCPYRYLCCLAFQTTVSCLIIPEINQFIHLSYWLSIRQCSPVQDDISEGEDDITFFSIQSSNKQKANKQIHRHTKRIQNHRITTPPWSGITTIPLSTPTIPHKNFQDAFFPFWSLQLPSLSQIPKPHPSATGLWCKMRIWTCWNRAVGIWMFPITAPLLHFQASLKFNTTSVIVLLVPSTSVDRNGVYLKRSVGVPASLCN
jgi:hypothetical protein